MSEENKSGGKGSWKVISIGLLIGLAVLKFAVKWDRRHSDSNYVVVNNTSYEESPRVTFSSYYAELPLLEAGYSASTAVKSKPIHLITRNINYGASPVGKLESIEGYYFMIQSYSTGIVLHMLEVYNGDGDKLNEYPLYDMNHCNIEAPNNHSRYRIDGKWQLKLENLNVRGNDTIVVKSRTLRKRDLIDTLTVN